MKRKALLLLVLVLTASIIPQLAKADTNTFTLQSTSDDYIFYAPAPGVPPSIMTSYSYGMVGNYGGNWTTVGFVFKNVNIPQGATIQSAYLKIEWWVNSPASVPTNFCVEMDPNADVPSSVDDWNSRTRSSQCTLYTFDAPTPVARTLVSIDVTTPLQELINDASWVGGNVHFLLDQGGSVSNYVYVGQSDGNYTVELVVTYSLGAPDVQLSATTTSTSADPNSQVQFTVTLTNNGTASGTYSISASDTQGWSISVNPTSAALDPGQNTTITVTANVPFVAAGTVDTITVTATETSTGKSSSVQLSVTVNAYLSFEIVGFSWLEFDGSISYVLLDDPNTLSSPYFDRAFNQRTVFVEFYVEDTQSTQCIYEEGGLVNGMNIYISGGNIYGGAWSEDNNWNGAWISAPITPGWHKAMLIFDYSGTGTMSFYLDGSLVDSVSVPVSMAAHPDDDCLGRVAGSSKFHTGDVSAGFYFKGKIKYFIVWNAALTDAERSQVFLDPINSPTTNLILFYAPDSLTPSLWRDKSGTGNHGTIYSATPVQNFAGTPGQTVSVNFVLEVTSNVNFNVNVYGTDFSDGSGHTIPISNFYADKDGSSPYDLTLSNTAQTLYANQAFGETLSLPVYLFVTLPSPLPQGVYTGTIYVDVIQA